jgi:prephenate dehydratase
MTTPMRERTGTVAYQGAPGASSGDAAIAMSAAGARLRPCRTLEEVFAALADGRADAAVVPIESLAGRAGRCPRSPGCPRLVVRP